MSDQAAGRLADSGSPNAAPAKAAKDAVRPVDEWVKLIRRLRYEGNVAEAAKQLALFRDAYKDRADALLPSDLRSTAP
jgi:hypothetical protein